MRRGLSGAVVRLSRSSRPGAPAGPGHLPPRGPGAYCECMERNDLDAIRELLWYHHNVERVDASIYGLPADDFDDRSLLTVNERLGYRAAEGARPASPLPPPARSSTRTTCAGDRPLLRGDRRAARLLRRSWPPAGVPRPSRGPRLTAGPPTSTHRPRRLRPRRGRPGRRPRQPQPADGHLGARPAAAEDSNHVAASHRLGPDLDRGPVGNNAGSTWECDPVSYYQRSTGNVYHAKMACNNGYCGDWTRAMLRYSTNDGPTWADCGGRPGQRRRRGPRVDHGRQHPDLRLLREHLRHLARHQPGEGRALDRRLRDLGQPQPTCPAAYTAISPDINVAADGHAYVAWHNFGRDAFKISGSTDCGATWTAPASDRQDRYADVGEPRSRPSASGASPPRSRSTSTARRARRSTAGCTR